MKENSCVLALDSMEIQELKKCKVIKLFNIKLSEI